MRSRPSVEISVNGVNGKELSRKGECKHEEIERKGLQLLQQYSRINN